MRSFIQQFDVKSWPISTGPVVVFAYQKKYRSGALARAMHLLIELCAGNSDSPIIFHMRDGPPSDTDPPRGMEPPEIFSSGFSPPKKFLVIL